MSSEGVRGFSPGGIIHGEPGLVRIERLGIDDDGFALYSINGGRPERIYTADDVRESRGKVYRVTGHTDEGEPRLTRIDT